ncbi:hypothetical protein B0H17DRAFT_1057941 [Mycena rosella]|uniref:PIN domain-containing protein n=1 Tax=Mycena rosella TaxID=1033263 RepID=A0AAD7DKW2_MYCRO|nr:hypothetical protein B0H17DRAFT_1057941 [Mycena rosella]
MHVEAQPVSRKGKERESSRELRDDPQPTNIDERLIQARRRAAKESAKIDATRPRERADRDRERPQPQPPATRKHPQLVVSDTDADAEDFSRRLKITASPTRHPAKHSAQPTRLFNPDRDPIPMRRTAEPDAMSEAASSSYAPRGASPAAPPPRDTTGRQLFDHRKDDPVRFVLRGKPTPTPKSSGEYVSASSTSSYANSMASSTFTLSSTTDGSSASSALFDRRSHPGGEDRGTNVFAIQLKKLYRAITDLETKVKQEDSDDADDAGRVLLKPKAPADDDLEKEKDKWKRQIEDHKELAEIIHNLLEISLAPSVPASLRNIPTKYNIIIRLWTFAFHKLLESLRRASMTSPLALEHLQDFIYYAYTFYTGLLEEPTLNPFKSGWLEALGDLARYKMHVAAMVVGGPDSGAALTADAVSAAADPAADLLAPPAVPGAKSISDAPAARIDDSPSPSIGLAAARLLDVEPEKERWRCIAREWYGMGVADQPGHGKLHHHLGLLSREVEREELRGVYHFVRSMTTVHPFVTSRESVLPMWSVTAQARRALPEAPLVDLFVLLHGMLFTNIQLDDFQPTLARFIERLEIEGAEEREWIMMAVINVCAVLEYGKPTGVLKKAGGVGTRDASGPSAAAIRVMSKRGHAEDDKDKMDVDEEGVQQTSPAMSEAEAAASEPPVAFRFALQLLFAMLSHVLRRPTRKPSPFARSNLNPYLTIVLTFLATVLKHQQTLEAIERSVPWDDLAAFFARIPRHIMASQGLASARTSREERWAMLTTGCAPPLPEDWCLRGMEWVGRKVYQQGFWKTGEDKRAEIEVLDDSEAVEITDGHIEDDDDEGGGEDVKSAGDGELAKRWVRIVRCAVGIADVVDGFTWVEGTRQWRVEGALAKKAEAWKDQDRLQAEEDERRRMGTRWADDSMDVDEGLVDDSLSEESEDEDDTEEVKALKARRRYLQSLLSSEKRTPVSSPNGRPRPRSSHAARASLPIVPGYTILVIDTNILLSSLSLFASVVESLQWTVVIPLPVIMELDGLSSNPSQLGEAAQAAMTYLSSHIRSHATSLKVQTSKGNYLTSLSVRAEQVDFASGNSERNMDDLILKAAIWQDEHWVNRSAMLKSNAMANDSSVKVVLLSLDRNLRLKARSRQLPAAGEKDLAAILVSGT